MSYSAGDCYGTGDPTLVVTHVSEILVVDDDPSVREVLSLYLTQAGFDVRQTEDGPGCLAAAAATPADLVLLDIMLPGMDGYDVYRALREQAKPRSLRRSDYGRPRVLSAAKMEHYCELIAAIKVRTSNKKGRHLSTAEAIRLLEEYGIETPEGFVKIPRSILKTSTVNRYLKQWEYDYRSLLRQPPAVRFQARHSNECWQFDLSTSDLKKIKKPAWIGAEREGNHLLMLYSVVDDRSGVAYQEYRCVYGEDVEAALRFLFNAMSPKEIEGLPFQGIPEMIYMDNGPIARSHVFQQVMAYLGVEIRTHLPRGKNGRRVTARSKGLNNRVILFKHVLRNAMIPVVTLVGLRFGFLIGGLVIVEEVFGIPGLGRLVIYSISKRDFPLVLGVVFFIALSFMLINLLVDVLYAVIDPRISYGKKEG